MPQIRLEYSANLVEPDHIQTLFKKLHEVLRDTGGIRIGNCKSRLYRCDSFRVGAGEADGAFVHLEVRILEGRSPELKRSIGQALLDVLREAFEDSGKGLDLQITVEICDIVKGAYFKHPAGTLARQ